MSLSCLSPEDGPDHSLCSIDSFDIKEFSLEICQIYRCDTFIDDNEDIGGFRRNWTNILDTIRADALRAPMTYTWYQRDFLRFE